MLPTLAWSETTARARCRARAVKGREAVVEGGQDNGREQRWRRERLRRASSVGRRRGLVAPGVSVRATTTASANLYFNLR